MYKGEKNLLGQPDTPAEAPKNPTSEISANSSLASALDETNTEKPHYFEKIDSLSSIDENKLAELQEADLVLVYRNNSTYTDMSSSIKSLVEQKYGGKVYCVSIPQGTTKLDDNEMELLKNILNTCHCMTDNTVSNWAGIECPQFEDYEHTCKNSQKFLGIIENLEKKFVEKGIDTVYVYISSIDNEGNIMYTCSDHGSMLQRENGNIYYERRGSRKKNEETEEKIEDFKRFWKNRFPNLNVEFIEEFHGNYGDWDFSEYESEGIVIYGDKAYKPEFVIAYLKKYNPNFDINFYKGNGLTEANGYKSEGSVLIADRHAGGYISSFQGPTILYAGNNFESQGGIADFLDENDAQYVLSTGTALARTILSDAFNKSENYFEEIDSLSSIDENKLAELQKADMVLLYRNSDNYKAIKKLVEKEHISKVFHVTIPRDTEKFNDKEVKLIHDIIRTCHCLTDLVMVDVNQNIVY